jgi:hypothetical protein
MSSDEEKLRLEEEKAIELFKIKKLITSLQRAKGNGTSMISCVTAQSRRYHCRLRHAAKLLRALRPPTPPPPPPLPPSPATAATAAASAAAPCS